MADAVDMRADDVTDDVTADAVDVSVDDVTAAAMDGSVDDVDDVTADVTDGSAAGSSGTKATSRIQLSDPVSA